MSLRKSFKKNTEENLRYYLIGNILYENEEINKKIELKIKNEIIKEKKLLDNNKLIYIINIIELYF